MRGNFVSLVGAVLIIRAAADKTGILTALFLSRALRLMAKRQQRKFDAKVYGRELPACPA